MEDDQPTYSDRIGHRHMQISTKTRLRSCTAEKRNSLDNLSKYIAVVSTHLPSSAQVAGDFQAFPDQGSVLNYI